MSLAPHVGHSIVAGDGLSRLSSIAVPQEGQGMKTRAGLSGFFCLRSLSWMTPVIAPRNHDDPIGRCDQSFQTLSAAPLPLVALRRSTTTWA